MSKAILVLDEVEECEDCDLFYIGDFGRSCQLVDIKNDKKPSYCPLKELPDFKGVSSDDNMIQYGSYHRGWNDCLDAILGEEE